MERKKKIQIIKNKIAEGKTELAFNKLGEYISTHEVRMDLKNHYYGLSNQFQIDKRNRIILETENYGIQNSITQRLLKLIDEIVKSEKEPHDINDKKDSEINILNDEYSQSFIIAKEIERQKLIINSKINFLNNLSQEVWIYLLKVLNVAYDKAYRDKEQFEKTYQDYDSSSWIHLSSIKGIIGGSVWFTEDHTHNKLNGFYNWLLRIDVELESMVKSEGEVIGGGKLTTLSNRYSKIFDEIYSEPDKLFKELKNDFDF